MLCVNPEQSAPFVRLVPPYLYGFPKISLHNQLFGFRLLFSLLYHLCYLFPHLMLCCLSWSQLSLFQSCCSLSWLYYSQLQQYLSYVVVSCFFSQLLPEQMKSGCLYFSSEIDHNFLPHIPVPRQQICEPSFSHIIFLHKNFLPNLQK